MIASFLKFFIHFAMFSGKICNFAINLTRKYNNN